MADPRPQSARSRRNTSPWTSLARLGLTYKKGNPSARTATAREKRSIAFVGGKYKLVAPAARKPRGAKTPRVEVSGLRGGGKGTFGGMTRVSRRRAK